MNVTMSDINTLLLCDESKFYINAGDFEDSIYYFSVVVKKQDVAFVDQQFKNVLAKYRIQSETFHAKDIFREKRPRERLMADICKIILDNELHCFCFKYYKPLLFETTKHLEYLNSDIMDFNDPEFQALFYFLVVLNTHLRDNLPELFKPKLAMYFDRNVYGKNYPEAFVFPSDHFVIKRMTFSEKSLISLLALPDFLGYIFRKAKMSHNKVQFGNKNLETSKLIIHCHDCILRILDAHLFHFLDTNEKAVAAAIDRLGN
jgi:hypothetical protein